MQGILLVILSIYVFNNPEATLLMLTFYLSLLVLLAGLIGVLAWLAGTEERRDKLSLTWALVSLLFGILLLARMGFAMNLLTNLVGIWMILTGLWIGRQGISNMETNTLGIVAVLTGLVSVITGIIVIFNIGAGAVAVSTVLGIQLLFAGIGLIMLGIVKKSVMRSVRNPASPSRL